MQIVNKAACVMPDNILLQFKRWLLIDRSQRMCRIPTCYVLYIVATHKKLKGIDNNTNYNNRKNNTYNNSKIIT